MLKERHTHRLKDIRVYICPNNQTFAQNMTTIRSFAFKTVKRSYTLLSPTIAPSRTLNGTRFRASQLYQWLDRA